MMYCPACGNQMHETAKACPSCGKPNVHVASAGPVIRSGWFGFNGRISRKEYWLHYMLPIAAIEVVLYAFAMGTANSSDPTAAGIGGIIYLLVCLVLVVPSLAGAVKRVHDRDRTGWFILIMLIPLVGPIWFFVEAGCLRGTIGANRFGGDPLETLSLASPAGSYPV